MIKVAHYTVSFHRDDRTGLRIAALVVDPQSAKDTFPTEARRFHAAHRGAGWKRDRDSEASTALKLLPDADWQQAWDENLASGRSAKVELSDLLVDALKATFSDPSVSIEATTDGRTVLALYARSALPLTGAGAQASAASRFSPGRDGERSHAAGVKPMRMTRNSPLKSWF